MPPISSTIAIQYVATGVGLGVAIGTALTYTTTYGVHAFCVYTLVYAGFFLGEFLTIATYQSTRVTPRSFLIWGNDGSFTLWFARSVGWLEHWYLHPQKSATRITLGVMIALFGLGWRWLAMAQCGDLFNHTVERVKRQGHLLHTSGLYLVMRHPLYFGVLLLEVGTQLILGNRLMMVGGLAGTTLFFALRVKREEKGLVEMYGQQYQQYRSRVPLGLPLPEGLLQAIPTTGLDTML